MEGFKRGWGWENGLGCTVVGSGFRVGFCKDSRKQGTGTGVFKHQHTTLPSGLPHISQPGPLIQTSTVACHVHVSLRKKRRSLKETGMEKERKRDRMKDKAGKEKDCMCSDRLNFD